MNRLEIYIYVCVCVRGLYIRGNFTSKCNEKHEFLLKLFIIYLHYYKQLQLRRGLWCNGYHRSKWTRRH